LIQKEKEKGEWNGKGGREKEVGRKG